MSTTFDDLSALFLNCSLERDPADSHTRRLLERAGSVMASQGVEVETVHLLEHEVPAGMHQDLTELGLERDDWPAIQRKVLDADILVLGTPIWLGVKSSLATLAIERLYASSGDRNDKGQYVYYGRTAGCVITGNEDGAKAVAMETLYAFSHIGYTIPPQADCAWLGEAGPGPSYGDELEGSDVPAGYDNDFTNRNTTIMAWNLMHTARMLRDAGGVPALGNQPDRWREVANATDVTPS